MARYGIGFETPTERRFTYEFSDQPEPLIGEAPKYIILRVHDSSFPLDNPFGLQIHIPEEAFPYFVRWFHDYYEHNQLNVTFPEPYTQTYIKIGDKLEDSRHSLP